MKIGSQRVGFDSQRVGFGSLRSKTGSRRMGNGAKRAKAGSQRPGISFNGKVPINYLSSALKVLLTP
jgi:hypothetical protein